MQPVVKHVEPEVHLIARPQLDYDEIARYLADVGGSSWLERLGPSTFSAKEKAMMCAPTRPRI